MEFFKSIHFFLCETALKFILLISPTTLQTRFVEMSNMYSQVLEALEQGADVVITQDMYYSQQEKKPKRDSSHLSLMDGGNEQEFDLHKYGADSGEKEEKEVQSKGEDNQSSEGSVDQTSSEESSGGSD